MLLEDFVLYGGTFPDMRRKQKFFLFDDFLREDASAEDKRKALVEIYQTIKKTVIPRYVPESITHLKIAIASSLYRDRMVMFDVIEMLGTASCARYVPQEMKIWHGYESRLPAWMEKPGNALVKALSAS